ncbi:C-C motif chemokine 20 isoform X2 [Echeneis naucrates]|uniref:C-C motif chemokine 20 isoform X2 n=1 Tax=Echeneis naucrates TaxID=173247 RepID=UPI0011143768|nr:C-C motif chemokine 20-like isoform X2 [Echeneis naucrates]
MRVSVIFFLLSLMLCLALAQVSYDDCCLKYVKKLSHGTQKHAVKYRHQETDGGCNIPAIIFTMRKGRVFCANPGEDWVLELMHKIDKKGSNNSNNPPRRHQKWSRRG